MLVIDEFRLERLHSELVAIIFQDAFYDTTIAGLLSLVSMPDLASDKCMTGCGLLGDE